MIQLSTQPVPGILPGVRAAGFPLGTTSDFALAFADLAGAPGVVATPAAPPGLAPGLLVATTIPTIDIRPALAGDGKDLPDAALTIVEGDVAPPAPQIAGVLIDPQIVEQPTTSKTPVRGLKVAATLVEPTAGVSTEVAVEAPDPITVDVPKRYARRAAIETPVVVAPVSDAPASAGIMPPVDETVPTNADPVAVSPDAESPKPPAPDVILIPQAVAPLATVTPAVGESSPRPHRASATVAIDVQVSAVQAAQPEAQATQPVTTASPDEPVDEAPTVEAAATLAVARSISAIPVAPEAIVQVNAQPVVAAPEPVATPSRVAATIVVPVAIPATPTTAVAAQPTPVASTVTPPVTTATKSTKAAVTTSSRGTVAPAVRVSPPAGASPAVAIPVARSSSAKVATAPVAATTTAATATKTAPVATPAPVVTTPPVLRTVRHFSPSAPAATPLPEITADPDAVVVTSAPTIAARVMTTTPAPAEATNVVIDPVEVAAPVVVAPAATIARPAETGLRSPDPIVPDLGPRVAQRIARGLAPEPAIAPAAVAPAPAPVVPIAPVAVAASTPPTFAPPPPTVPVAAAPTFVAAPAAAPSDTPRPVAQAATPVTVTVVALPVAPPAPPQLQPAGQAFAAAMFAAAAPVAPPHEDANDDIPLALVSGATPTALHAPTIAVAATGQAQSPTLDLARDDWMASMIDHIETLRDESGGVRETRMKLAPEALGHVEVSIRRDENGAMQVRIAADTPQARAILADAAPRLAEMAEARGVKLGGSSVDSNTGSADQHRRDTPAAPAPVRPRANLSAANDAADATTDTRLA